MQKYDLVCQLGSQVMYVGGRYELAPHTLIRTMASVIILNKGIAPRLVVLGGSNFGVRYDDNKTFNDQHPTQKKPIFTFEAFAGSDYNRKSEATVIKERIINWLGNPDVHNNKVLAETLSSTTEENAAFLAIMLKRRPDSKSRKGILGVDVGTERIGILTNLSHMEKALPIFRKAALNVEPVFAENIVVLDADAQAQQTQRNIELGDFPIDAYQIDDICKYYSTPKGGKQYDVDHIRQLLTEGKSLEEMMWPYWCVTVIDGNICADGEPEEIERISTRFTQARNLEEAALKLGQHEAHIRGPFKTLEEARQG